MQLERDSQIRSVNIHRLYNGVWAKPVPATVSHLVGMVVVAGLVAPKESLPQGAALFAAGWFLWTFFEYGLHRWILHSRNPALWRALHKEHHAVRRMDDPRHRVMHPAVAVPVMGGAALLTARLGGPVLLAEGFWLGYVVYELIHWAHHNDRMTRKLSRSSYFRRRVAFHHRHHFEHARTHYGFTTQFWDRVFRTARPRGLRVGSVRRPRELEASALQ